MKSIHIFCSLVLVLTVASCKSPSEKIKEEFDKVNESLEKSNDEFYSKSWDGIYKLIDLNRVNNGKLALKADTVYNSVNAAKAFLDSIKTVLQTADATGGRLDVASKLLINTTTGKRLQQLLLDVNDRTTAFYADSIGSPVEATLFSIHEIRTDSGWSNKYFSRSPTVAAQTILSKFQGDCIYAGSAVLMDIMPHMRGQ